MARESGPDRERQVERAYLLAFGRPPAYDDKRAALAFLDRQTKVIAARPMTPAPAAGNANGLHETKKEKKAKEPESITADRAALMDFCHALFNANEFCHVE